ncbi:universal stress protein [Cupriavidus neocaledonicus]|uniref:Universal stress protein UspA family n=1 Tax=Cupriavidus neocaledonicus TaxID=1040979 RepID=A0A375HA45_9BURK|nr:universal stress protein [Cupriavidus neocaledonicus]SOZ35124.1 putative universal stress protein; UspA family [Cupriavidus neocaledonicus]SPD47070.1 putative universal stress protein UspA family [Cupriavidus neocaledonicus]
MFQHILLPTDGSELSKKAINGGLELAKAIGARVTAYVCLEEYPYTPFSEIVVEAPQAFKDRIENQARLYLKEVENLATAAGVTFDADMSTFAVPYLGIIDAAERHGCDVIFMASHGRRGLSGLLLGSETQKVLTHTDIPVIVYR